MQPIDVHSKQSAIDHWREELAQATADAKRALERIDKAKQMLQRLNTRPASDKP